MKLLNALPEKQRPKTKTLRLFFTSCLPFILAFLAVANAQTNSHETFSFSTILEGPTPDTTGGFFQSVEVNYADPAGGQLVVFLGKPNNTCLEQYLVTWTFSKDMQTISLNETFGVDYVIAFEGGDCNGEHTPSVEVLGSSVSPMSTDYAQDCEAILMVRDELNQPATKAFVNQPEHIDFKADSAATMFPERSNTCGYAYLIVKVQSRGTEYDLVYVYSSQ